MIIIFYKNILLIYLVLGTFMYTTYVCIYNCVYLNQITAAVEALQLLTNSCLTFTNALVVIIKLKFIIIKHKFQQTNQWLQ